MKITITKNKQGISMHSSEPITTDDLIQTLNTVILSAMQKTMQHPKLSTEHSDALRNYLFDVYNESASSLLAVFAPSKDLRPDITEEAILQLEKKIAHEKMSHM